MVFVHFRRNHRKQGRKHKHNRLPLRSIIPANAFNDDASNACSAMACDDVPAVVKNTICSKSTTRKRLHRYNGANSANASLANDEMPSLCNSDVDNDDDDSAPEIGKTNINVFDNDDVEGDGDYAGVFDADLFACFDGIFDDDFDSLATAPSSSTHTMHEPDSSPPIAPSTAGFTTSYSPSSIALDLQESRYVKYLSQMKKFKHKRIQTILSRVTWVLIFVMQHEESATTSYDSLASVVSDLILTKHIVLPDACSTLEKRRHRLPGTIAAYLMDTYGFCKWFTVFSRENMNLGVHRIQNSYLLNMQTIVQDLASGFRKQVSFRNEIH